MSDHLERMRSYRERAFKEVYGWVGEDIVTALEMICGFHHERGIAGDALEIGVFQGRFFLALAAAVSGKEVSVAVDIFDKQDLNVDDSGKGENTYSIFCGNVKEFVPDDRAVRIITADSMVMRSTDLLKSSGSEGFRFISVDGGHTAEHVMNDLAIAADTIVGGGVVFLDDFHNPHWPGVHEGYVRYMMHQNKNLAPVLYVHNKLIMTTISHHAVMVEFFAQNFYVPEGRWLSRVKSGAFSYLASN